jgi:hypothetical protein
MQLRAYFSAACRRQPTQHGHLKQTSEVRNITQISAGHPLQFTCIAVAAVPWVHETFNTSTAVCWAGPHTTLSCMSTLGMWVRCGSCNKCASLGVLTGGDTAAAAATAALLHWAVEHMFQLVASVPIGLFSGGAAWQLLRCI